MDQMVENEWLHSTIRFIEWSNKIIHFNQKLKQVADVVRRPFHFNRKMNEMGGGRLSLQLRIEMNNVCRRFQSQLKWVAEVVQLPIGTNLLRSN